MARTPLIHTMARPPEIVVGPEVHYRFRHDRDFGLRVSIEGFVASLHGGPRVRRETGGEGADEIAKGSFGDPSLDGPIQTSKLGYLL
jgi:hypothetical protein